jgi:hypothetical protein
VVVTLGNQSIRSKTISDTTNPTWNQTLCIEQVYIYGTLDYIIKNPPEVIVDLYDEDPFDVSLG